MSWLKIIGYFAYFSKQSVLCDGDACVIAGSEQKMINYLLMNKQEIAKYTIKKTRFEEIMAGINQGAAYCFDEESYNIFYPLARKHGLNMDFYRP
ncbi:hypothetical protein HZA55_04095 [Candidatus Poribacteria bacterium]|nr:hypothetical protein [Candidatus Poribacteria bacterium]